MMFSSSYFYLYFLCLCLYINAAAENDKFWATNDSFDFQRRLAVSPNEVSRWKSTEKTTTHQQANSSFEDTVSGIPNKEEVKNKKELLINEDFTNGRETKAFKKREANEEKILLPTYQVNSSKTLGDFSKDLNVTMATNTNNLNLHVESIIDADNKLLYTIQNEINVEIKHLGEDFEEVTTDEDLTAEDRYPNYVPTDYTDVGANPHLLEPGLDRSVLEKHYGIPETFRNAETHEEDGSKVSEVSKDTFNETLEKLDDIFTTVKATQEIIYDPNKSNVTLLLVVLGESFKAFLDVLNKGIFSPNAQITVHDKKNVTKILLSTLKDLNMYEGVLDSQNRSYVCGSIVDGYFTGILMLDNGTVWFVERPENGDTSSSSISTNETDVSFQNCSHTKHSCHESRRSGCKRKEGNKIACFEGRHEHEEKPQSAIRLSTLNNSKSHHQSSDSLKNATCAVELISDPSHFKEGVKQSIILDLRDFLSVFLLANHVLRQADLDGDGKAENLSLRVSHVTLKASDEDDEGPALNESFMDHKLNTLLKHPQNSCLAIMFLCRNLTEDEPVSVTYGGSVCQNSQNGTRPPMNVAVVNTGGPLNRRRALLPAGPRLADTIGKMMGSSEWPCKNPSADPSLGDSWLTYFPDCSREGMARTLTTRGSCLETHQENHTLRLEAGKNKTSGGHKYNRCGNGIVDSGEECDCGDECGNSCCIQSGKDNQCQFDRSKGYECEWSDSCCTMSCKIVPKEWKKFCGSGDPGCGPKHAYCNGRSSSCPKLTRYSVTSDGHRCGPGHRDQIGAGTCHSGHCNSTVCKDAGLEDCHCGNKSHKACKVCCKNIGKDHPCVPAEYFGLKSNASNFFYRYPGLPCSSEKNEYCDSMGTCISRLAGSSQADAFYSTLIGKKVCTTIFIAWTVLWRVMCLRLV